MQFCRVLSVNQGSEHVSVSSESVVSNASWNQSAPKESKMPDVITSTEGSKSVNEGKGFLDGLWGCLRPMWSKIGKTTSSESKLDGL